MAIIGVDEAGKGPVIGSMFVVAARVQSETKNQDKGNHNARIARK